MLISGANCASCSKNSSKGGTGARAPELFLNLEPLRRADCGRPPRQVRSGGTLRPPLATTSRLTILARDGVAAAFTMEIADAMEETWLRAEGAREFAV
jgi:hypothetical protein